MHLELTDHNTKTPSFVKFLLRTIENYPSKTQGGLKGRLEINFFQKRSCEISSNTIDMYSFHIKIPVSNATANTYTRAFAANESTTKLLSI